MRGWVFNYLMDFRGGVSVLWTFGVCVKRSSLHAHIACFHAVTRVNLQLNEVVSWCEVEVHNRIGRSPSNALPRVVQVQTRSRRLVDARWTPAKVHSVQVTRAHLCPEWGSWSVRMWELECQYIGIGVGHSTRYVCID